METNTRKQKILDTARDLFIRYGYDDASLQRIIDESGVSKGWVYYYFSSKEDLFEAVVESLFAPLLEGIEKIATDRGFSQKEKALRIVTMKKEFWIEQFDLMSSIFGNEKYLTLKFRGKAVLSSLMEPFFEKIIQEGNGEISEESLRIVFWFHEMLLDSMFPWVRTVSDFIKYMEIADRISDHLLS